MRHPSTPILAVLVLVAVLVQAQPADAGGWTQPEGAYYLKIWQRGIVGNKAFDAEGEIVDTFGYQDYALNIYGEYGITDGWTAVLTSTPVGWASVDRETIYSGPSSLGVRRAILQGPVHLALEARYGVSPGLGDEGLATAPRPTGQPGHVYVPAIQSQRADGELQIGYGLSWGWITGSVAGRWESSDFIDPAILGFFQVGYQTGGLVLDVHVGGYEPLGDVEVANVSGVGQTRYLGLGPGVSYWITDHFGVNAAAEGVFYAYSNAATPSLLAGIEIK